MNEKLKSKIAGVICDETDLGLDVSAMIADKIAALVDRDYIEIREAVKRLIEWAKPRFDCLHVLDNEYPWWSFGITESGGIDNPSPRPDWLGIIADGHYTPAAVEEGLRDLFVSRLGGTDGNDDEPES